MLPTSEQVEFVRAARVAVAPDEVRPATLMISADGVVLEMDARVPDGAPVTPIDVDHVVVPAPLDLHVHGAGGVVVAPVGSVAELDQALADAAAASRWRAIDRAAPRYDYLATLPVPGTCSGDPVSWIERGIADAAAAVAEARTAPTGSSCVGLRLEGGFLAPTRAGVWPPQQLLTPSVAVLERLHAAARDGGTTLRIVDIAPELPGALDVIARAVELGIVVALAHTDATYEEACAAIDAGATLATHTWNAMRPLTHRDPGVIAAVLTDPRVTCELICDGVHLHPGTIALTVAAAGTGGWAVISDASPFAGLPPGTYEWAGTTVRHDGTALRDAHDRLAGSAALAWAARDTLASAGVTPLEAALAVGASPRRVLDPTRPVGLVAGDPVWVVPG